MAYLKRPNPFTDRNIIQKPGEFFGRRNELSKIFTRLQGLQSISIYGERKIGKSSLLSNVLYNIPLELGNEYKGAYINLRDSEYYTAYYFLKSVLSKFGCDSDVISENNSYNANLVAFSESIKLLSENCKPILLIDDFDYIIKKPDEFNIDFLEGLRHLGSQGYVAYVTTSLRSLKELCNKSKLNSTFYMIFYELPLGELTASETTEFLSAKRKGVFFSSAEIKLIKEVAGRNPLRLRIACYHIYANGGKKWKRDKLKEEIEIEIKYLDDQKARTERSLRKLGREAGTYIFSKVDVVIQILKLIFLRKVQ